VNTTEGLTIEVKQEEDKSGQADRLAKFEDVHGLKQADFEVFLRNVGPFCAPDGRPFTMLDGMGGYGDVTAHINAEAGKQGVVPDIYIADESSNQLNRGISSGTLPAEFPKDHLVLTDIRETPFTDEMFDTVVIKMGIHEVPLEEQSKILKEVYRVLKRGGKFVTWELAFSNKESQKIFQDIIRKKDEIAGFTQLVEKRWFPTEAEIFDSFGKAGFVDVSSPYTLEPTVNLRKRESELASIERSKIMHEKSIVTPEEDAQLVELGKQRCSQLVAFTKEYMSLVSQEMKDAMNYRETEDNVIFEPEKKIFVGYKK
jgi:ubiquinone/menaquinone biosynthesis C-methylase UbiE